MPDTPPPTTPPTAKPAEPTDDELKALQLEKAKQALRQEIAAGRAAALAGLAPGVDDPATGTVTLAEKAGALGPWLAHRVVAEAAAAIADAVASTHLRWTRNVVILVTDEPDLLAGDVFSRQVLDAMASRTMELGTAQQSARTALETLERAITAYSEKEEPPEDHDPDEGRAIHVEVERFLAAQAVAKALTAESEIDEAASGGGAAAETDGEAAKAGEKSDTTADSGGAAGAGPIGAAVDLVRLLATDFTLTSSGVSTRSATLATVTAGAVSAKLSAGVVLDGVTVSSAEDNGAIVGYRRLAAAASETAGEAQRLRARAASVSGEAAELRAAADAVRADWTAAASAEDAPPEHVAALEAMLNELTLRVTRRTSAAAAATSAADAVAAVISVATSELSALTTADGSGKTPLVRTCSREGLRATTSKVTHVLMVEAVGAGGDVITRRSILGSSGRVGYLAGANTAWALVEVARGVVIAGGSQDKARQLTHDLTTGKAIESEVATGDSLGDDPLAKHEAQIRLAVLVLAAGLALLGVLIGLGALLDGVSALLLSR